jgi:hypothetical protein
MGYLTESQLDSIIEMPISLSATSLKMGDWLIVGSIKIQQPMRLTVRMLNLQVLTSTADVEALDPTNLVYGNLGLVYVVMRKDYMSGTPGASGGVDSLIATSVGYFVRDITVPIAVTDPGVYSWIIANNTQPSTANSPGVPIGTSIDFEVALTGSARLELNYNQ